MPAKLASCCPIVVQLGDGDAEVRLTRKRRLVLDQHEAITVGIGERFEQHTVDHAEDCGVGADPEAERDDRKNGEARALTKSANAVLHVLDEVLEPAHAARVACFFLVLFHRSKIPHRSRTRRLGGHALADVLVGFHLDVKTHFRIELAVHAGAVAQCTHLMTKTWFHGSSLSVDGRQSTVEFLALLSSDPTHQPHQPTRPTRPTRPTGLQFALNTRATAPAINSHCAVSSRNCRAPVFVSR